MEVKIWGARGSLPVAGPGTLAVGGNTPCVEVKLSSGRSLVLDAGTGIRALGLERMKTGAPLEIDLLLTHFHWDHIQGLPFFAPLYVPGNVLRCYSGFAAQAIEATLRGQMEEPCFPLRWQDTRSAKQFQQIGAGGLEIGGAIVTPFALRHPGGSFAYRIACDGATIVFATDHEAGDAEADARLLQAARGAGLLLMDAQYTPDEMPQRQGWGHSSWLQAAELARRAQVGELVLFHHDPGRSDGELAGILAAARGEFARTSLAVEGGSFLVESLKQ